MKKSKLLSVLFIGMLSVLILTGCSKEQDIKEVPRVTKKNCTAFECIKKVEIGQTIEEVDSVIGAIKELDEENSKDTKKVYIYDLGEKETFKVTLYNDKVSTVTVDFENKNIENKKVNLSKLQDLKPKVNAGITYDEFKKELGNVDGNLYEKTDYTSRYVWVSTKGGNVKASFRNSDNKCTFFTGIGDSK